MRIIIDTNVWISYLLAHDPSSSIQQVVHACFAPKHLLIVPVELIAELEATVAKYPYLGKRIQPSRLETLLQLIYQGAWIPPALPAAPLAYGRDAKDDYLIAYGLHYRADYLVTGDQDLLVLGTIDQLQIVPPAVMREIFLAQGLFP